jgi:hypothetical protein
MSPSHRLPEGAAQTALTIKTLAGFDFTFQPSLDREQILALADLTFIDRAEVVHLLAPPGTGKSHLATALAVEAVKAGRNVVFSTQADLIASLAKPSATSRYASGSATSAGPPSWSWTRSATCPSSQAGATYSSNSSKRTMRRER